ncbi:MAG: SCO family protein [Novosphingobium sp.]|nr:SCO family protein [Novosphingobium sp.]
MTSRSIAILSAVAACFVARAQPPSSVAPAPLREITVVQKLNARVNPDLAFRDEHGNVVKLRGYFRRPVVLALGYFECPMLCSMVLNGTFGAAKALSFRPGRDYDIVSVSIAPNETPELAEAKKASYLQRYGVAGAAEGWHFLTGEESQIRELARSVGFQYRWDEASRQYAHASAIMVLTPEGRVSRYFYGIEYAPRELRLALVEASAGRIGNPVDQLLLYCFHYDPATGKYGLVIMNALRIGGLLLLGALAAFYAVMWSRSRKQQAEVLT